MWSRLYKKYDTCQRFFVSFLFFCTILSLISEFMITILSVSDGFKHFRGAIDEYIKRLGKHVHLRTIRPISHTNPEYIRERETLVLLEALSRLHGTVILLDERGKWLSTHDFAHAINTSRTHSNPLVFIIGGSYGVDRDLFKSIPHQIWKLSEFVMPHGLALLVLLEQVYRAHEIIKWSKYHH